MVYSLLLLTHVIGLVLFAGTTVILFIMASAFWKSVGGDLERAKYVHGLSNKLGRLVGIGALLLIISGVSMVASTKGVVAQAMWFKVKFALVILAIINGVVFGRIVTNKLTRALERNESKPVISLRPQHQLFYSLQIIIITAIVSLGVMKAF